MQVMITILGQVLVNKSEEHANQFGKGSSSAFVNIVHIESFRMSFGKPHYIALVALLSRVMGSRLGVRTEVRLHRYYLTICCTGSDEPIASPVLFLNCWIWVSARSSRNTKNLVKSAEKLCSSLSSTNLRTLNATRLAISHTAATLKFCYICIKEWISLCQMTHWAFPQVQLLSLSQRCGFIQDFIGHASYWMSFA